MGNNCCAFKGNKKNAEDAYSRTSIEHMSIEKMAEDRVKKTTSSSASESMVKEVEPEDKTHEEVSKEEMERAGGGGGEACMISEDTTASAPVLYDTPKRPPTEMEKNEVEDETGEIETARIEENGRSSSVLNTTPNEWDDFGEEDDVVGEILPSTYDLRPIRPLPTPLRKVDITPTRRIEMLCDDRGRVKRNEKITRYLDDKRKSYESNNN